MDCLREETVPVPGLSGAQSSEALTRQQPFKEGVCSFQFHKAKTRAIQ